MAASKTENKRGLKNTPQPGLGIFLDRDDLKQLRLLGKFEKDGKMADPKQSICLARHKMTDDLSDLLLSLKNAGRVKIDEQFAKHSFTPQQSGNVIIRPGVEDMTMMETFNGVELTALKPLLDFQEKYPKLLNSATIFPNFSSRGLKGISLDFDPQQNHWWRVFSDYNWPFGRGLIITALPLDTDQFIDRSEEILGKTFILGSANPSIKYIRFFYDNNGKMFMATAIGPSDKERKGIADTLKNTHKPGKTSQFIREAMINLQNRRQDVSGAIIDQLNLQDGYEEVCNTPYVTLHVDLGQAISGGVGLHDNIQPFNTPDTMLVYSDPTDKIFPIGTRREVSGNSLATNLGQGVKEFVGSVKDPLLVLSDIGVAGYHPEMEQKKPVKK